MSRLVCFLFALGLGGSAIGQLQETFRPLNGAAAPQNFQQMWGDFNPREEPLEIEVLKEWESRSPLLEIRRSLRALLWHL